MSGESSQAEGISETLPFLDCSDIGEGKSRWGRTPERRDYKMPNWTLISLSVPNRNFKKSLHHAISGVKKNHELHDCMAHEMSSER